MHWRCDATAQTGVHRLMCTARHTCACPRAPSRASIAQALRLRTLGANRSTSNINEQRRRDLLTY